MTTSHSDPDLFMGSVILADARKDEWFAQILRRTGDGLLGFRVESTAMAFGRDEVLRKVCTHAGIESIPPPAFYSHVRSAPVGVVQGGLTVAMRKCETAVGDLARLLGSFRNLTTAVGDLVEVMENG